MTNQKTLVDSAATFCTSLVSTYNQTIANTDTSGIDARIPPIKVLRLLISDIAITSNTVMAIFVM